MTALLHQMENPGYLIYILYIFLCDSAWNICWKQQLVNFYMTVKLIGESKIELISPWFCASPF